VLFFADCAAQIMSVSRDAATADGILIQGRILDLGYALIRRSREAHLSGLRLTIARQFSVVVSELSVFRLQRIMDAFKAAFEVSDPSLFFVFHRFVRLSRGQNVPVGRVTEFMHAFNELAGRLGNEKEAREFRAMAMYTLVAQVNSEDWPQLAQILSGVFRVAFARATGKKPRIHHMALCAAIIMREHEMAKTNYARFLKRDVLRRAKNAKFLGSRSTRFSSSSGASTAPGPRSSGSGARTTGPRATESRRYSYSSRSWIRAARGRSRPCSSGTS